MRKIVWAVLTTLLTSAFMISVQAATIFSEDFQAYADNTNLSGQGGWLGDETRVSIGFTSPVESVTAASIRSPAN